MLYLGAICHRLRAPDYVLVDVSDIHSDIQKRYSRFQEGLAKVRDGSSAGVGRGYWLLNLFGVNRSGNLFIPLLSRLYSFAMGTKSENQEILGGIKQIISGIGKNLSRLGGMRLASVIWNTKVRRSRFARSVARYLLCFAIKPAGFARTDW